MSVSLSDGRGSDSTACALAGLNRGETSRENGIGGGQGEVLIDGRQSEYIMGDIGVGV